MSDPSGRRRLARSAAVLALLLLCSAPAVRGHVNSPHIYLEENAGPWALIVIVHMPPAVPGEAEVQVRLQDRRPDEDVRVRVRGVPPQGEEHAPDWVAGAASDVDPDFFTAPIPLMLTGLWHGQVEVSGSRGEGRLEVPIPARVSPARTPGWQLRTLLLGLAVVLLASLWHIMTALGREGHRLEQRPPDRKERRRGLLFALLGVALFGGWLVMLAHMWWVINYNYRIMDRPPLVSKVEVTNPPATAGKTLRLRLTLTDSKKRPLAIEDVEPDHGKMMHMAVVKMPDASYFLHVHPVMPEAGTFVVDFTPPGPGTYKLFGDILHPTGEGVTVTNLIDVGPGPAIEGEVAFGDPDDSHSFQPPVGSTDTGGTSYNVGDGLTMRWVRDRSGPLVEGEFVKLAFEIAGPDGETLRGLEPYMGMKGHLLTMREDAEVFAHLHPMGSISGRMMSMTMPDGTTHEMPMTLPEDQPAEVSFPFGFPEEGTYRMWVQMKYGGKIYTGVFDTPVEG